MKKRDALLPVVLLVHVASFSVWALPRVALASSGPAAVPIRSPAPAPISSPAAVALVTTTASASCAHSGGVCPVPDERGKTALQSRVSTRREGATPPSAEYRRPADEVVFLPAQLPQKKTQEPRDLLFSSGKADLSEAERTALEELAARLEANPPVRLRFVGHTDPQNLSPETRKNFQDNTALSVARALGAASYLRSRPALQDIPMETAGVADRDRKTSCSLPHARMSPSSSEMDAYKACMAEDRRVEIQIWYPQKIPPCQQAKAATSAIPFRISIDGVPLKAGDVANSADQVRCTDMALERADIRVRFDPQEVSPALNVTVDPPAVVPGEAVTFIPYSNYAAFVRKAEVRLFQAGASLQTEPLATLEVAPSVDVPVTWTLPSGLVAETELVYVLRVYDSHGRHDETQPRLLHLVDRHVPSGPVDTPSREQATGYGENHLATRHIPLKGGMVTVDGKGVADGSDVWVLGRPVPLDREGKFAYRQILPVGEHQVDIVTEAPGGKRHEYHRPVRIQRTDWFYVGQADLTLGAQSVRGPASLVTGQSRDRTTSGLSLDGRLAYYAKGKLGGGWSFTSSADTQEQPLERLFSNMEDRNPRYLLRRLDSRSHYQVYGDDSTALDDAPTQGKFFVGLERDNARLMWGSFQTRLTGTDLMNYSRSLYGANGEYRSLQTTRFGERQTEATLFMAEPGTLPAFEEFRGTGGSLYYLRSQDILAGSERVRIEVRDRDSGMVLQSRALVHGEDYDINPMQGRLILNQPLASTSTSGSVVSTGPVSGNPVYLVVGYEYTPGVASIENFTQGGRVSRWVSDHLRLGATSYRQNAPGTRQTLLGLDATLRYAPGTYLKLEGGRSTGPGSGAFASQNGGFDFSAIPQPTGARLQAQAYRAEVALDLMDITHGARAGTVGAYFMDRERGYSAPGQLTDEGLRQSGATAHIPVTGRFDLNFKADQRDGATTGRLNAGEISGLYRLDPSNSLTLAVRGDDRQTGAAGGASTRLSKAGQRVDAALKWSHAPRHAPGQPAPYEVYFLGQGTLYRNGERPANNRGGVGATYALNDRVQLEGEATAGSGGWGGKAGAAYQVTDRTSYYANYLMDTDRSDIGYRGRSSSLVGGARTRYSDSLSVFTEHRYQTFNQGPSGLIHSFGLDLAASDSWSWGARTEAGTLSDAASGDIDRLAASVSANYVEDRTKYSGSLEWRQDQSDTLGDRTSWFMRNTVSYQTTPDWRFLGGLDFAISDSGLGGTYDADYTEFFLGYAYRPVKNDRLNLLAKYTYLDDTSSPGQRAGSTSSAASDYQQRSHVFSLDGLYDVTPRFSVGGKLGYRYGSLRDMTAPTPEWNDSAAWLVVARANWEVVREWDALAEWRYLAVSEAEDSRTGALVALYRHVGDTFKVGAGYNFTDFSDDLTDLDYTSHGFFLNILGTF